MVSAAHPHPKIPKVPPPPPRGLSTPLNTFQVYSKAMYTPYGGILLRRHETPNG